MRTVARSVVMASTLAVALGMASPAQAYPGGCSVSYSGTDARQNCTFFSVTYPSSRVYMSVTGYAFAIVKCNEIQVFSSGLRSSGTYSFTYFNPGGNCRLETGVNGSLYASAN